MNTIIDVYNKITKKELLLGSCMNCHKTEQELVGSLHQDKSIKRLIDDKICLNCEILLYPERFHGCGFCKRPIRQKFSCTICASGFNSWIRSQILGSDALSHMLRISADSLLDKQCNNDQDQKSVVSSSLFCDLFCNQIRHETRSIDRVINSSHKFILRTSDSYYKWPGFYAGVTDKFTQKSNTDPTNSNYFPVWIIPQLDIEHYIKYTNLKPDIKMFQHMILKILESNNIKLYEDIQIDLEVFDMSRIKEANPYDTRIVKPIN